MLTIYGRWDDDGRTLYGQWGQVILRYADSFEQRIQARARIYWQWRQSGAESEGEKNGE